MNTMRYNALPNADFKVPSVALGTWAIGGSHWGEFDDNDSIECIRKAVDYGMTFIDTAPVYGHGHSEEIVGKAIKGLRDKVLVSTKCGLLIDQKNKRCLSPASIRTELQASLKRLDCDVVDLYFCHWPDKDTPIEETVGALTRIREEGLIRAFGLSNHGPDLIERAAKAGPLSCLQDHYSLLQRDIEGTVVPVAQKHGLAILAYAPLGGGILTGKYSKPPSFDKSDVRDFFYPFYREPLWSKTQELLVALRDIATIHDAALGQVAIAWACSRPCVAGALVGARTIQQAESNAAAGCLRLTESECVRLTAISDKVLAQ